MSENILVTLLTSAGALGGVTITAIVQWFRHHSDSNLKAADILLDAERQLKQTMSDNQMLWAYNRQLIDHIYSGSPPPPPPPPAALFHHETAA